MNDWIQIIRARLANMLRRCGVVFMADPVAGDLPRLQAVVMAGEVKDGVPVLMPFGFAMRPRDADGDQMAETLVLMLSPNHAFALPPADRRYAPTDLEPGEVILYTDEDAGEGFRIKLARGRQLKIVCADADVQASGDVKVTAGDLARIDGDRVRIRGASSAIFECNGHGFELTPSERHDWNQDAGPGSVNDINAPEVPES